MCTHHTHHIHTHLPYFPQLNVAAAVDLGPGSPLNRSMSEQEDDKMEERTQDPGDWVQVDYEIVSPGKIWGGVWSVV